MFQELGITHRYTRPYRSQANEKIERFWRTLNEDLLDETTFESVGELQGEMVEYLLYYNTERPHQGLGGKSPSKPWRFCQQISWHLQFRGGSEGSLGLPSPAWPERGRG